MDNLPNAVVEADRKAEEALQKFLAARQQTEATKQQEQEANPQPPIESVAQTATPTPAPQAASEPPPQPATPAGDDKWEARYKTLHGKYNAEVPRLHAAMKERDAELSSLKEEVQALKNRRAAEPLVKPEEVQEFGEPLVDLIRRAAREEAQAKDSEIQMLKDQLKSIQNKSVQTDEQAFYQALGAAVPDWSSVNDDPEFHAWLGEYDELTGYQRQEILAQAESRKDAARVIRFFDTFKKSQAKTKVATENSLANQVAPVTNKVDAPPSSKRIWTREEMADFYARDRRNEFTNEQSAAIDKEIQAAIRERRIR